MITLPAVYVCRGRLEILDQVYSSMAFDICSLFIVERGKTTGRGMRTRTSRGLRPRSRRPATQPTSRFVSRRRTDAVRWRQAAFDGIGCFE